MKSLFRPLLAVFATAWLIVAPAVTAHPVGFGTGTPTLVTTHTFDSGAGGWVIGSPTAPIGITADPQSPPWLKLLQVPTVFQFSTELSVIEHLVVGQPGLPGPAWTDWHEHIVAPGWDWISGEIRVGGVVVSTGVLGADGLPPDLDHSPNIWFDFAPLQPGTELTIVKTIHCHVQPGCDLQQPIQIVEYPTIRIPEPATLALIGAGLLGALGLRSRRTQRIA